MVLVQKEIKRVTIRPNGTEKQIRPVWWRPWANTIAYYSFDDQSNSQITDASWNWYNLIWTAPSYQQLSWTDYYWVFTGSQWWGCNMTISWDFTQIMWINISNTWQQYMSIVYSNDWTSAQISIIYGYRSWEIEMYTPGNRATLQSSTQLNTWYLVSITKESWTLKWYINGVYKTQFSTSVTWAEFYLGRANLWGYFKWGINNCILENKVRTAQEISDYYNQTKWNYWL